MNTTKKVILQFLVLSFATTSLLAQGESGTDSSGKDSSATPESQELPVIMDSGTGKEIEFAQLMTDLRGTDVIFLGEQHDNDSGHTFQLDVIKALVGQDIDVVISMEQFERDVQGVVDDYLAGRISEEKFLANSRPWRNYERHYRPIIELARKEHLPVLAANVPREIATNISRGKPIGIGQQSFLPRSTNAPENAYWENFSKTMKGHLGTDGAEKLKNFYASQCLKDDAMAESITDYLARNGHRKKIVVHLCGHFHSDYGFGTVARVVQRAPLLRTSIITMETIPDDGKPDARMVRKRGHFIFWTVKNKPADPEPPSKE